MIDSDTLKLLRSDTPGCENRLHFNNAGSSLMPKPVHQAVVEHLQAECDMGGYEAEASASETLGRFYTGLAELLRVQPSEIAYVENATRAWDMAFYSYPFEKGDRVITHASEYVSNYLAFLQLAKRRGIEIDLAPSDDTGQIDVQAVARMITPRTKMLAITHVPTQGGLVNPVIELGRIAKEHGLTYLLDACQSVGQIDVDVSKIGCDMLSGTGRKFLRGPRGTGFLYISSKLINKLDPPFIDLTSAKWTSASSFEFVDGAKRFENFESYIAGRIGLAAAVDYALKIGLPVIEERNTKLAALLRQKLEKIDGVDTHDLGERKCSIVTFSKAGKTALEVARALAEKNINVSVTVKESAQLDFGVRGLSALTRASVHYFNTEDEVNTFCAAVSSV